MGLFDRLKKPPGPDALTWEAVARVRAVPGVVEADVVDADTITVTWQSTPTTSTLSLTPVREDWSKATGFRRIELMDDFIAGVSPPDPSGAPEPLPTPSEPSEAPPAPVPASEVPIDAAPGAWEAVRDELRVVVGTSGRHPGAIVWSVAGLLEARAVTGAGETVQPTDAASWGVDPDAVRAAALTNLAATDPGLDPVAPGQPAWVPTQPAAHPPAWLAAPDRLLAASGLAAAVVLAPTPTELVLVDPEAHELLRSILASTRSILAEQDHVLWPAPFLATPAGLAAWAPAPDHPCADLVAELGALDGG